jgi:hypothetical protein
MFMSEVLSLQYNASAASLLVTVDSVNDQGVTIIGAPAPQHRFSLVELDTLEGGPQIIADLRSVLARLEPLTRAHAAAAVASAAGLRAEANRLAQAQHVHAIEVARHAANVAVSK